MAHIFRMEDGDTGEGVYHNNIWTKSIYQKFFKGYCERFQCPPENHPSPQEDPLISKRYPFKNMTFFNEEMKQYSCGFSTLEQMEKWIPHREWRDSLHDHGAVIVVYQVSKKRIIIGQTQTMFQKDYSTPIGTFPINADFSMMTLENINKIPTHA